MILMRTMELRDIDNVYRIESTAHLAPWSRSILVDCMLIGYDCRVLEENHLVVGYVICRKSFNTCHILNLCIDKAFQHKGLGKLLLDKLLSSVQDGIIQDIILEVRPSNSKALALYQGFDFHCDSIKKDYYKDENGIEDALLLKKTLFAKKDLT